VNLDAQGHYTVMLGAVSPNGLPLDLFTSGKALWLGVQPQISGAGEQPRVLLVAVPYALKAADADSLGGKPASAYLTTDNLLSLATGSATGMTTASEAGVGSERTQGGGAASPSPKQPCTSGNGVTTDGNASASQVAFYSAPCTLTEDANFVDVGGKVGIGTPTPAATLEVNGMAQFDLGAVLPATGSATSSAGANSNPLDLFASSFNSATSAAVSQDFRWLAEPTGNNTTSPAATLSLQYGGGGTPPSDTGLQVAPNGHITFASGQQFPGGEVSGAVPEATTADGLNCTGCVGNAQLGVNYAASNTQGGPATTAGNATNLGGVAASNYARLDIGNSFNGNQSITGNVSVTGSFSGASAGIGVTTPQNLLDVKGAVNTSVADFDAPLYGIGDYAGIQLG